MIGLAIAGVMLVGGLVAMAVAATLWLVFRLAVFVVLLPFRLLFALVALPLLLLKFVFVAIGFVVLMVALAAGGLLVTMGLLVPLLPLALVVGVVWMIVSHARRPAAV